MINKKNLWFLTLFSLILVLSVYYITMPSELLLTNSSNYINTDKDSEDTKNSDNIETTVKESSVITALKIANEEEVQEELDALKLVLSDNKSTANEKNEAFDKMKNINELKTEEENIVKKIKEKFELDSFVKIEGNNVKVVINLDKHDKKIANNIMRTVQENFDTAVYVTVEFKS